MRFKRRSYPRRQASVLVTSAMILTFLILSTNLSAQQATERPDSSKSAEESYQAGRLLLFTPSLIFPDRMDGAPPSVAPPGLQFRFIVPSMKDLYGNPSIYPELYMSRIDKELSMRASGGQRILLSPLVLAAQSRKSDKWEKSGKEFDTQVIPSNLQLKVLTTLWRKEEANGLELYADLDSSFAITAENFGHQMKRMMKLGLVERKLISPQNLFTIITPMKMFEIEMSGKNRRNRVFLYRARTKMAQIVQLLLGRFSLVKSDENGSTHELDRLREKLKIVLADYSNN